MCYESVFVLPGRQLLVLQTVCCSSGPTQAVPLGSGSRRTVLFRIDDPPPHVALHSLQGDHSLNKHPTGERHGGHRWKIDRRYQRRFREVQCVLKMGHSQLFMWALVPCQTWTWWHITALWLLGVSTGRTALCVLAETCPCPLATAAGNWAGAPWAPGLIHRAGKIGTHQSAILTHTADGGVWRSEIKACSHRPEQQSSLKVCSVSLLT